MKNFSDKEKKIIKQVITKKEDSLEFVDFLKVFWPGGRLEVSSFMQTAQIFPGSRDEADKAVAHIVQVIDLIKYLKEHGYLKYWEQYPQEDNLQQVGEKPEDIAPQFLPDLGIAHDVLKLANQKFVVDGNLVKLVRNNFRAGAYHESRRIRQILISGFALVAVVGLLNLYAQYTLLNKGVKVRLDLRDEQSEIIERNLNLNKKILDSLRFQNGQLIKITERIDESEYLTDSLLNNLQQNTISVRTDVRTLVALNEDLSARTDSLSHQLKAIQKD